MLIKPSDHVRHERPQALSLQGEFRREAGGNTICDYDPLQWQPAHTCENESDKQSVTRNDDKGR